jgi:hypothetical protein
VYIPNKVDKWGKKFAFVKFKGVKAVEELDGRLDDVWCGSFKLRVNRARFDRNEQTRPEERGNSEKKITNEGKGGSFKEALLNQHISKEASVLKVEVDKTVLEELQQSFVGVLAVEVEID